MKVLIVEDHVSILELIADVLKSEKFIVDTATNGLKGFEKAKSGKYDVIILDLMLEGKHGFEIIAGLRAMEINTPILVISALGFEDDKVKALDLGADDYLVKDFSLNEMKARIKRLIRSRVGKRSNIFKCGDLVVNLSDMSVRRGAKDIQITSRKEFGILVELIKNKNQVVHRKDLLEKVWGERDLAPLSNTIDVHVRTLRKKVDIPFGEPLLIKTIRGYGYMMKEDVNKKV